MKFIDLQGQKFGRLTVLYRADDYVSHKGSRSVRWVCRCDCGKETVVRTYFLKSGKYKSCGCYRSEEGTSMSYETDGETTICVCGTGKKFLIDTEDLPKVKDFGWHIGKNGYVYRNDTKNTLHRILTDAPNGTVVDHINHNRADNRKSNLRVTSQSVNGYNKRIRVGCSGEPFITYQKNGGYYCVYIDGKYRGGSYDLSKAKELRDKCLEGSKVKEYNYYLSHK